MCDDHLPLSDVLDVKVGHTNSRQSYTITLPKGVYHAKDLEIFSQQLTLIGQRTKLIRSDGNTYENSANEETSQAVQTNIDIEHPNCLFSGQTVVCAVSSSDVTISDSDVLSNLEYSPFMISNDVPRILQNDAGHWIHDLISVSGSGLTLSDQTLILGSGPLFSFKMHDLPSSSGSSRNVEVNTCLSSSRLLNVTSFGNTQMKTGRRMGSEVKQTVIGCSVSSCTNHDSGTTFLSPNWGGSLTCQNSSFSSCVRTSNAIIDHKHQNITKSHPINRTEVLSSSDVTSVTFTLCTFDRMSVDSSSTTKGGAAIHLNQSNSTLSIHQCSFHICTVTVGQFERGGGAILLTSMYPDSPITITSSSFTECESTASGLIDIEGGALLCDSPSTLTMSDCFFEKDKSINSGAASLCRHSRATLTNCFFVSCEARLCGGGLGLTDIKSVSLSFLRFRKCVASGYDASKTKDIFIKHMDSELVETNAVVYSDSSSSAPTITVHVTTNAVDATVEATSDIPIAGTVGILLAGSNVPRLVQVVFGVKTATATTGSVTVSSGANGILPPATYTVRSSSYIPYPRPTIKSAESARKDENTTKITLNGVAMDEGSYSMQLSRGGQTWNVSLIWEGSKKLTGTAPLYPSNAEGRLNYSTLYTVTKVEWISEGVRTDLDLSTKINFTTPSEPTRIEKCLAVALSPDRTKISLSLEGRLIHDRMGYLSLNRDSFACESDYPVTDVNSTHATVNFRVDSSESDYTVEYGKEYTLQVPEDEADELFVNEGIVIRVPHPPRLVGLEAKFNPQRTAFTIHLTGTDFVPNAKYTLQLNSSLNLSVTIKTTVKGESVLAPIGLNGKMKCSETYTLTALTPSMQGTGLILNTTGHSFTTLTKPTNLELLVGWRGFGILTCGDEKTPCDSLKDAMTVVEGLSIKDVHLRIMEKTYMSKSITVGKGMNVLVDNGTHPDPLIDVVSTELKEDKSGLIVVSEATFAMKDVTVKFSLMPSSSNMVLISASSSTISLKDGWFSTSGHISNQHTHAGICSWSNGVIQLSNSDTTISNTKLAHLPTGAINMKGGNLTIESCSFHDNNPRIMPFLSSGRNIHCTEDGKIEVGSLNGGDGLGGTSAWISADDCTVTSSILNTDSLLFIPTLSNESSVYYYSTDQIYSLTLKGTLFMPCGLWLEVFEITEKGEEGDFVRFELSPSTSESFREEYINFPLPASSLSKIDSSLEWRARLVYGNNQKTPSTLVVKESTGTGKGKGGKEAEMEKDKSMWWIPLVACLVSLAAVVAVVLVLLWRRRVHQKMKVKRDEEGVQQQELVEDKVVVETKPVFDPTATVSSVRQLNGNSICQPESDNISLINSTRIDDIQKSQRPIPLVNQVEGVLCSEEFKIVVADKTDTLFNRLHRQKIGVDRRQTQLAIAKGLKQLESSNQSADALMKFTSQWVHYDADDRIVIQMNDALTPSAQHQLSKSPPDQELQRWQAPEQKLETNTGIRISNQKSDLDPMKIAIYRLGLVMWEIETGSIPFRELDGTSAHRTLCSGTLPKMDGSPSSATNNKLFSASRLQTNPALISLFLSQVPLPLSRRPNRPIAKRGEQIKDTA
ncbi:hypothetical protein BLNAU_22297 [Blattamonas nauphoetae]|uniref:Uncharacterized protein n=1 Tax=Blattamonas nauphoetae TaxID=2049346 RepID=A0ABQ9WTF4_9EUKA|nr:hypothetical protein BLNAU_22297 [Blattamonas nauphoetae]